MPSQPGWLRIIVFFCCFAFQIELVYLWLYVSAYKPLATAKSPKFQDLYWSWAPPPSHVPPVPISMNLLSEGNVLNEWKNEEIKCSLWVVGSGWRVLFRKMEIKFRAECGLCISVTQTFIFCLNESAPQANGVECQATISINLSLYCLPVAIYICGKHEN